MEIRQKTTTRGTIFKLVNEGWSTSGAWGHKTTVIRNSYDYEPHKVRYYNRTWESYTFQTCMSGAVETIYENKLNNYIQRYKEKNEIIRFKKGEKEKVIKEFEQTDEAQDLLELKQAIRDREFDNDK